LYVRNKEGIQYNGKCWPGDSVWFDFFNPKAKQRWGERYHVDNYHHSTEDLMFWNDMNEPSVFEGPDLTIHKDVVYGDGWEDRDVHNMYGFMMTSATSSGLKQARPNKRSFILSRSFFSGSQRFCAIWNGM